ncbi:hypothetical protein AB1K32_05440 [Metabacillus dongyingensis]|uniref:hypothetical protein n=1 Tax=Metabacillus dongyingensis TaxID=2874282 RepID=UPI003B8B0DCF
MIYEIEIGTEKGKLSLITLGLEKEDVINSLQTDRFFIGYTHTGLTFGLNANEIVSFDIQKRETVSSMLAAALTEEFGGETAEKFPYLSTVLLETV